jgi:hypothetical protein
MMTKMKAGALVAAYVDDSMGRRLVLGTNMLDESSGRGTLIVAKTRREAAAVIATLHQLAEELPP